MRAGPPPVLPGSTLGILGGGQLGRMLAMAARTLGFGVHALDPDPSCPARGVVDRCLTAEFDDPAAAADLARNCDVVTIEIEKVAPASLVAAAEHAPVRPAAAVLEVVQDRARQKGWLRSHGFPLALHQTAGSASELELAVQALGGDCIAKALHGGYDGRSQVPVLFGVAGAAGHDNGNGHSTPAAAWRALGGRPCVVEQRVAIEAELSVLLARRPSGEISVHPLALNHHSERILDWSVIPAPVSPDVAREATEMGVSIATELGVEGLLAVELFLLEDGRLLVNELAPRPHNTFHHTELACITGQFEQGVRAVCDLPLGATDVRSPVALANLLGDIWLAPTPPRYAEVLALPGVRLYLYGKKEARPGRKMGHLCAFGSTAAEAVDRVRAARARLAPEAARDSSEAPSLSRTLG